MADPWVDQMFLVYRSLATSASGLFLLVFQVSVCKPLSAWASPLQFCWEGPPHRYILNLVLRSHQPLSGSSLRTMLRFAHHFTRILERVMMKWNAKQVYLHAKTILNPQRCFPWTFSSLLAFPHIMFVLRETFLVLFFMNEWDYPKWPRCENLLCIFLSHMNMSQEAQ